MKYSSEYENALANLIIMLSPIAPHFASELWSKFLAVPNRCAADDTSIQWTKDVLEQSWPTVNKDFQYWLDIRVSISLVYLFSHFDKCDFDFLIFQD